MRLNAAGDTTVNQIDVNPRSTYTLKLSKTKATSLKKKTTKKATKKK